MGRSPLSVTLVSLSRRTQLTAGVPDFGFTSDAETYSSSHFLQRNPSRLATSQSTTSLGLTYRSCTVSSRPTTSECARENTKGRCWPRGGASDVSCGLPDLTGEVAPIPTFLSIPSHPAPVNNSTSTTTAALVQSEMGVQDQYISGSPLARGLRGRVR